MTDERFKSTPPAAPATQDELEKARAEQWRLRREAEGSRDAARAAADSLRIERDTLRAAIEPFAKLYSEIPEDNFWPSEEYRNLGIAAEAYALSASPSPVTEEGGGNAVPQTLDEIIENSLRMWYFNYDPSLDHTAARIAMREIIKYVIDVARVSPVSPSPVDSRDALIERLEDKIEGLEADLDSAVEVAYRRGATEWTRLNYPDHFNRLSDASPSPVDRVRELEAQVAELRSELYRRGVEASGDWLTDREREW